MNNIHWKEGISDVDNEKIQLPLEQMKALKEAGLTAAGVSASFLRRCIQPLQQWKNYGFEYRGVSDPARLT